MWVYILYVIGERVCFSGVSNSVCRVVVKMMERGFFKGERYIQLMIGV